MVRIAIVGALGAIVLALASPALAQQAQERVINLDSLYADPIIVQPVNPQDEAGQELPDDYFTSQTFAGDKGTPAQTGQMFPDEPSTGSVATWSRVEESKGYLNPAGPAFIGEDVPPLGSEDAIGSSFWGIQSIF